MIHKIVILFVIAFLITGCTLNKGYDQSLMPIPTQAVDPSDSLALKTIRAFIDVQKGPKNSQYDYSRIDLNNDGLREALFLFKSPYHYWCGWAGCMMVILSAQDNGFTINSTITDIRGPLIIANTKTNGWRDLIVRVSGTNLSDRTVKMPYNGASYPSNPSSQSDMGVFMSDVEGTRTFP